MSRTLFDDGLVRVSTRTVTCGDAKYQVQSIVGVRVFAIRETAGSRVLALLMLSVGLDFTMCGTVCKATGETQNTGFATLAVGALLLFWAIYWAPQTHVVAINVGGAELNLARYPSKQAALDCGEGIQASLDGSG